MSVASIIIHTLIYLFAIAQIAALIGLVLALRRLKNGLVARSLARAKTFAGRGQRLATVGQNLVKGNKEQAVELLGELGGILSGVRYGTRLSFGAISYKSLLASVGSLQMSLGLLKLTGEQLRKARLESDHKKLSGPAVPGTPYTQEAINQQLTLRARLGQQGRTLMSIGRLLWTLRNELRRYGLLKI